METPLYIRPASEKDAKTLFDWRNDEGTRQMSGTTNKLTWEEHLVWIKKTLAGEFPGRRVYIVETDTGEPVGTVRSDERKDGFVEVSYAVAPDWRGKGIGRRMVVQFVKTNLSGKKIAARIKKGLNPASEAIARAIGLEPFCEIQSPDSGTAPMIEWRMPLQRALRIALLMDNANSWFAPYADRLSTLLRGKGHTVTRVSAARDLPEGDCAFFLSVENIIPHSILRRHDHNIVIHGSAVPQGKGWSPMTWQILEGKDEITVSLFEAAERVDSGNIYDRENVRFDGTELIDELREKEAAAILSLALRFVDSYPPGKGEQQSGKETFYERRNPSNSELNPNKTLLEVFNQLRVADNERYPAFFTHKGHTYVLKIYKKDPQ